MPSRTSAFPRRRHAARSSRATTLFDMPSDGVCSPLLDRRHLRVAEDIFMSDKAIVGGCTTDFRQSLCYTVCQRTTGEYATVITMSCTPIVRNKRSKHNNIPSLQCIRQYVTYPRCLISEAICRRIIHINERKRIIYYVPLAAFIWVVRCHTCFDLPIICMFCTRPPLYLYRTCI